MIAQVLFIVACCSTGVLAGRESATSLPITTSSHPIGSLESPIEAAATSGDVEESTEQPTTEEDICLRCYEKVRVAQSMIAKQMSLLDKQKALVQRKSKAVLGRNSELSSSSVLGEESLHRQNRARKPVTNNEYNQATTTSSTVRSRTLQSTEPIVISRLRVARSPFARVEDGASNQGSTQKFNSNKRDPELKKLKQEQQQQLNSTCKSLLSLQDCLSELSSECIGNLQFHSLEVYANQWHSKLSCPYRNNPGLRVFPGLRSTFIPEDTDQQQQKFPVSRRISSNEEVRSRLHEMFPNGFGRPFGVMLKPTLSSTSSQNFEQILAKQQQLRDFSGHLNRQQQQQQVSPQAPFEQQVNYVPIIGRILLVPCCIAIFVAVVALSSLYYWRPSMKSPF